MKCRRSEILAAVVVLFVSASPVMAVIEFKDGLTHDIDYRINDDVWVDYESPGLKTTLNILEGGRITRYNYLEVFEDGIINILGGSVDWFLYSYGSSQVTVSGGLIRVQLHAYDSSQVTVSGGSIERLQANNSSQITVSGGSTKYLYAFGSSQIAVSGGSIGGELLADIEGILTIHGWDFAVDGMPVGYTELYSILGGDKRNEPYRQLTGNLLNGDPIDNQFRIGNNGKIVLVPEPASAVILGLGGFFLVLRRRRRQA